MARLLFNVVLLIETHSASNVWNILFFQILEKSWCCQVFTFSHEMGIKWYLIGILTTISLIIFLIGCLFSLNGCQGLLYCVWTICSWLAYFCTGLFAISYWVVEIICTFCIKKLCQLSLVVSLFTLWLLYRSLNFTVVKMYQSFLHYLFLQLVLEVLLYSQLH